MAPPLADPKEKIAVLGAASPAGGHLKAALVARGVPSDRVALYGHGGDIAVISEYDGEARLVQPAVELDASRYGVVFVCEPGHDAGALTAASRGGTVVVDLSGTIGNDGTEGRLASVPHPVTLLLQPLLAAIDRALGLVGASAFVLRPAADFGAPGLEELREQTVHLLRFESTPTDVFGRQLAFSVVPENLFPEDERQASERVAAECRALLGRAEAKVAVSMALVPTFLGHAIALHVELARGSAPDVLAALAKIRGVRVVKDPGIGTSLDAPEEPGLLVTRAVSEGEGIVRLWVLGSEPGALAAVRALELASAAGAFVNAS
jgi:hypothetical protein